ncbi:OPT protein, partial [Hypocryptadius cinnamomeus]|nr:OPT protein [Hypocryptadius cinnamomeus]
GRRMCPLGWLGVASLCLGTLWAVPAKERRKVEKPKVELTLYENLDLDNYDVTLDNYGDILDLSNYEELYDYGDLVPKIEVGTLAPRPKDPKTLPELGETTAGTPKLQPPSGAGPVPPAPIPGQGLPSCLLCLCLGSSVYCDDAELEQIPALPPDTAYLYARFNRIGAIRAGDFSGLGKLIHKHQRFVPKKETEECFDFIPIKGEAMGHSPRISQIFGGLSLLFIPISLSLSPFLRGPSLGGFTSALSLQDLKQLQFLHLSDNQLDFIPVPLPESLRSLHLQNNNIQTMHEDTFCDSQEQGQIRRALEDIRLDGNPINLSLFPNAFSCLPRLPTGRF